MLSASAISGMAAIVDVAELLLQIVQDWQRRPAHVAPTIDQRSRQIQIKGQLIDAGSGAHLWADQFDAARAGLLDTQDEIVTRLARALDIQLNEVEATRLKRTPVANPTAEDLALQCVAGVLEGRYYGKEAEAGYGLGEKALALDPNNVRALTCLSGRVLYTLNDIERADAMVSKALALDPNYADAHAAKAWILWRQRRLDEAIVEDERALTLNPAFLDAYVNMGLVYRTLGRFDESLGFFDKAIRQSPNDPDRQHRTRLKRAIISRRSSTVRRSSRPAAQSRSVRTLRLHIGISSRRLSSRVRIHKPMKRCGDTSPFLASLRRWRR